MPTLGNPRLLMNLELHQPMFKWQEKKLLRKLKSLQQLLSDNECSNLLSSL